MKKIVMGIILIVMLISTFARAQEADATFNADVAVSSQALTKENQKKNFCYQLAEQGNIVEDKEVKPQWFESTDDLFTWRTTQLSSGLTCRTLIKGSYNLQFGDGAKKLGCECKGQIEVTK